MAKIISLSIDEVKLGLIDDLQRKKGFAGRSELLRGALDMFLDENKHVDDLQGFYDAILLVSHKHNTLDAMHKITHDFHGLVKTQLHQELESHKCLDVLMLKGSGSEIKSLYEKLQKEKKIEKIKLVVL